MEKVKPVFIIAEAGVNHNGSVRKAKQLIDVAVEAGADAIKFQTFRAEELATPNAPKATYQLKNTPISESQFDMLKRLELSASDYRELFLYSKKRGIKFLSTPFDEKSADLLGVLGMEIFKIPSGEIVNKPLIQHIAAKGKSIILSTGMSYMDEVKRAVEWINVVWENMRKKPILTLLHCVTDYPADFKDVNLSAIKTLGSAFNLPVGLSDHTRGIEIPVAAVAMGATVIEKHFTLDRDMEGPDHRASIEPDELKKMISSIRNVESALGNGIKKPAKSEGLMRKIIRRSLVAKRDISVGSIIRKEDIVIKRPGTGFCPEFRERIIGKRALIDIKKDSLFKKEHFINSKKGEIEL